MYQEDSQGLIMNHNTNESYNYAALYRKHPMP